MNVMTKLNLDDLSSPDPKVKYACCKSVLTVAAARPAELYPHLDSFIGMLESANRIVRWTAIDVVGAMGRVEQVKTVDGLIDRLVPMLDTGNMITANHAIAALADIARARPEHRQRITDETLNVEGYSYDTDECRNIAIGKAIVAIDSYFAGLADRQPALEFVRRQLANPRAATAGKAARFLCKHGRH